MSVPPFKRGVTHIYSGDNETVTAAEIFGLFPTLHDDLADHCTGFNGCVSLAH